MLLTPGHVTGEGADVMACCDVTADITVDDVLKVMQSGRIPDGPDATSLAGGRARANHPSACPFRFAIATTIILDTCCVYHSYGSHLRK